MTSYSELKSQRKEGLDFWLESAKQDFMISVHNIMKLKDISKSELANSIGCSQPYISKVIKGDANFTIETMVKISRALESKLCIHLAGIDDQIRWMGVVDSRSAPRKPKTASHWAGVETAPSKVRRSVSHA